MPAAMKVFLWALLGGLSTGYLAFRLVFMLPNGWWDRPERLVFAFVLAAASGVAGAVTAGVVAGKKLRAA
jgi:hypothetical protein